MAKIGVISASKWNTIEGDRVIENFVRVYGANAVGIPLSQSDASNPEFVSQIVNQFNVYSV